MRALHGVMVVAMLVALAPPPLECYASDMCTDRQGGCSDAASCPLMFTCAPTDQSAEQPLRTDILPIAMIAAFITTASLRANAGRAHVAPPRALPGGVPRWLLFQSLII